MSQSGATVASVSCIWLRPLRCHLVMSPVLICTNCLYYAVHEKNWPQRPAEHDARLMNIWLHGAFGGTIAVFKVSSILLLKIAAKQAAAVQGSFISVLKKKKKEKNWQALVPMTFVWVFASVGALQRGWRRGGEGGERHPVWTRPYAVFSPGSLLSKTSHSSAWSDPSTGSQFYLDDKYITEAAPALHSEALKLYLLPTVTQTCNFVLSYWVGWK